MTDVFDSSADADIQPGSADTNAHQHTLGSWGVTRGWHGNGDDALYVRTPGEYVCRLAEGSDPGESEANARLIAAAPDLLEALSKIERYVLDTKYPSPSTVAEIARAAIAKAASQ